MKKGKKDAHFVRYLLKQAIYDVFVVTLFLEQSHEETEIE